MSQGDFIKKPDRRFKLLVLTQGLWMTTLLILALWWGTLLRQQGEEIANLESQLGMAPHKVQSRLDKNERMIVAESGAFVLLILITNGVLLFFFTRDTRRSRSLEAFFASVTHELRTPLTSIRLQAEALKDIEDNPKHTPFLNRLLEDVGRLEGQVQQTLELARIEGGGGLTLQSVRIRNFIQTRILPHYSLNEGRMRLTSDIEEAFIQADPSALMVILRNSLDNAIKYTRSAPTLLEIRGRVDGDGFRLEVIHRNSMFNGSSEQLGKLFYRGPDSQGAGVGLYLIKTLMEKCGGKAEFQPSESAFSTRLEFKVDPESEHHGT
jgi:signal transduction histidine kinase